MKILHPTRKYELYITEESLRNVWESCVGKSVNIEYTLEDAQGNYDCDLVIGTLKKFDLDAYVYGYSWRIKPTILTGEKAAVEIYLFINSNHKIFVEEDGKEATYRFAEHECNSNTYTVLRCRKQGIV